MTKIKLVCFNMVITPDLKQNIFYTVYFTVTHNLPVFIYGTGIVIFAFLSVLRPRRSFVLFLLACIILLFAFEYEKHLLEGIKEQTLNALITIQDHKKVRRIVHIVLVKALPILLPLVGWGFVIVGVYLYQKERNKLDHPV